MEFSKKQSNELLADIEIKNLSDHSLERLIHTLFWLSEKNFQELNLTQTELKKAQSYTTDLLKQINLKNEELKRAENQNTVTKNLSEQIHSFDIELKKAQSYTTDLLKQINLKNEELKRAKRRKYYSSRL